MSVQGIPATADIKHPSTTENPASAAPEATKPPSKEPVSPQYAALARRERQLREEKRQFEQERSQFQSREAEIKRQAEGEFKARLKSDPWGLMNETGLSFEQLSQMALNAPKPEDLKFQSLEQRLEAAEKARQQDLEQLRQSQAAQYENAKKQLRTQLDRVMDAQPEAFENIKGDEAHDSVIALIEKTYQEDGYLMPVEEAAKEVEGYLLDQYVERLQRKTIQSRLAPKPPVEAEALQKPGSAPTQKPAPMTTLSNRTAVTTAKPLSASERRQRAILRAQGLDPDSGQGKLA